MKSLLVFLLIISSCTYKTPVWIRGEWIEVSENENHTYYKFTAYSIYRKTDLAPKYTAFGQSILYYYNSEIYKNKLILCSQFMFDQLPVHEEFILLNENTIYYHHEFMGDPSNKLTFIRLNK
jgi:hypothetical protein